MDKNFPEAHPNLSDDINRQIQESAVANGVDLRVCPVGAVLRVQTRNTLYTLIHVRDGVWFIQGHPKYCPIPVRVWVHGSTWGGFILKLNWVGRGMHLEFHTADMQAGYFATTSTITEIEEVQV